MPHPPLELLKSTHTFPCVYTYKAIGSGPEFESEVVRTVQNAAGLEKPPHHSRRQSSSGKHLSLTIEVHVDSAERVLAIYAAIERVEGLSLLL